MNLRMIIRIKFSENWIILFGDSYKSWETQVEEYMYSLKRNLLLPTDYEEVEVSNEPWISWGGLKWCTEGSFQEQLNRESYQSNEPDHSKPRQYHEMVFYKEGTIANKLNDIFRKVQANSPHFR